MHTVAFAQYKVTDLLTLNKFQCSVYMYSFSYRYLHSYKLISKLPVISTIMHSWQLKFNIRMYVN